MTTMTMIQAITHTLDQALERDPDGLLKKHRGATGVQFARSATKQTIAMDDRAIRGRGR